MTSLVETNEIEEDIGEKTKKFEIELPVNYSLAKFLSKSLPEPNICEFLGIDIKPKYTLFNLNWFSRRLNSFYYLKKIDQRATNLNFNFDFFLTKIISTTLKCFK